MNELEALGEALMALSAQLHRLDTLADAQAHASYERVVDRFNRAWSAQGMSAGTAETAQQAQGEAGQPGPDRDAPVTPCSPEQNQ
jgi:hypothetical protein